MEFMYLHITCSSGEAAIIQLAVQITSRMFGKVQVVYTFRLNLFHLQQKDQTQVYSSAGRLQQKKTTLISVWKKVPIIFHSAKLLLYPVQGQVSQGKNTTTLIIQ